MDTADSQIDPNDRARMIKDAANRLAEEHDCDVFLYNADVARPNDDELIELCQSIDRRKNVVLILVTEGGDADAGYRIARCLQNNYEKFTCIVAGYCKSAGTLVAIGAHELVMTDHAELGPLDVQMSKRDELGEFQSGLLVTSALKALHEKSFSAFEHFFMSIKRKSHNRISFKMATDIAARLTSGLFAPMFEHIDAMHVGESYRATAIALHYGLRLDFVVQNLRDDALNELISAYPTHGFVIDSSEAAGLFIRVREPNEQEDDLLVVLGDGAKYPAPQNSKMRDFISTCKAKLSSQLEARGNQDDDTAPEAQRGPVRGNRMARLLRRQEDTLSNLSKDQLPQAKNRRRQATLEGCNLILNEVKKKAS